MKAEIVNVPNKGVCILISEIDVKEFIQGFGGGQYVSFGGGVFKDVYAIAQEIRNRRKIAAIKEIRTQTGWGLKEAKEYCDKYMPNTNGYRDSQEYYDRCADRFIMAHAPKDFLKDGDFEL